MIVSLILILVIVIFIALFIGKNLGNSCPVWFFKSFEDKNVAVIIFIAFAAGIVFSLVCMLIGKFAAAGKNKPSDKLKDSSVREELKKKFSFGKKSLAKSESSENKEDMVQKNDSDEKINAKKKLK